MKRELAPFITLPVVAFILGKTERQVMRLVEKGRFPRPLRFGPRSIAWPQAMIIDLAEYYRQVQV